MTQSVTEMKLPQAARLRPIPGTEAYAYHAKWIAESPGLYQPFTRERIIAVANGIKASDYADALRRRTCCAGKWGKCFPALTCSSHPPCPARRRRSR